MSAVRLVRGFKAEAERIALELRRELKIGLSARLEPLVLAHHLLVPVITLTDLRLADPACVRRFLVGPGRGEFSAATLYVSTYRRVVVVNPAHSDGRQVSSLCHELAHIVLGHESEMPLSVRGGRDWNPQQEGEADWLAGCLLIPADAAANAARRALDNEAVAACFGVSVPMAAMRMNATGARLIATRSRGRISSGARWPRQLTKTNGP